MTRPTVYLVRMAIFLAAVVALAALLSTTLYTIYMNNPALNGLILFVLLFGIAWNIRQVLRLTTEVTWLETYRSARGRINSVRAPQLLGPMASMMAVRESQSVPGGSAPAGFGPGGEGGQRRMTISTTAMRSLLDGIASRLDESRELSRYMTGLLIFLGLLGTFWGLLRTISAVSDVIGSMSAGAGDLNLLFEQLKSSLVRPLAGMGTAFSASLFGLAGALVLGFLDLTAGQAQNRFFNELEEWLAGITRLASGALSETDTTIPIYVQALLEQTAENMEGLQRILARGEDGRVQASQAILGLNERLSVLTDTLRSNQQLMLRIAEMQNAITPTLQRLNDSRGADDIAHGHLRNIETTLQRLLVEAEQGRVTTATELRNDMRILTRTVAALAEPSR